MAAGCQSSMRVRAFWTYSPDARPACPPPWKSYFALQYSNQANVPGIPGAVDANVYLGGGTATSTAELANFPMISQRDGDANQNYDCVPASIAACLTWLTGKPYTARQIKDAVYGPGYVGGTAAEAYIDYCAAQGVKLFPVDGSGSALVVALRNAIAAGHPALITEPDPYAAGWTHVCAAYKFDNTSITVMDPWIDQPVTKADSTWAAQLQENQIWVVEKAMLDISAVSHYFTDQGNSVWKCIQTGCLLGHGMLGFFRSQSAPLALLGLPRTNELAIPGHPGVVLQVFERAVLCYDPAHTIDNPPGAGDVYALHIDQATSPAVAQILTLLGIQPATPTVNTTDLIAQFHAIQAAATAGLKDLGVAS
jgi:hypothetical protein